MRGPSSARGRLIVLEGIDGSGKTTVARRLVEALRGQGHPIVETQEPTSSAVGQAVRQALKDPEHDTRSEALLFCADHAAHVAWLRGKLADGAVVISDRYSGSCLAYQDATLAADWNDKRHATPVAWLEAVLAPFELEPDLVLLLELPTEVAIDRIGARAGSQEKFEHAEFLDAVRANYATLAAQRKWTTIDASGTPEATLSEALAAVETLLEGGGST